MASLGDLVVTVGGDVSGFSDAIASVDTGLTSVANKAAAASDTFDGTFLKSLGIASTALDEAAASIREANTAFDPFAEAARQAGEAVASTIPPMFQFSEGAQEIIDKQAGLNAVAEESIQHFAEISQAYQQGAASAQDVSRAEAEMHDAIAAVNPVVNEAHEGFTAFGHSLSEVAAIVGVALSFDKLLDGLKDIAKEAVEAFGHIEMASAALTELTGSAESAEAILEQMKALSATTIFPQEQLIQAAQKMAALGVSAQQIPAAMQAVAAAAQVTGNGLDAVTGALDRIYLSATIQPRTLAQLGISMKDLAETMGISADKVTETFKQLGPQSDAALQILTTTIDRRMADASAAMEGTLPVAINRLKNDWHNMLEEFGKEIAPNIKDLLAAMGALLPVVESVASAMVRVGTAVTDLKDVIDIWKLIGSSISYVGETLKSLNLQSIGGDFLDFIVAPLKAVRAAIIDQQAVVGVLTGKYPDLTTAITALNDQLTKQKTETTGLTDEQKASKQAQDDATAAAVRQAQAAEAAAEAHKHLKETLAEVTNQYQAVKAQFEGGTATQEQLAASLEALRVAAAASGKDFTIAAGTTKDFQEGLKSLADAQKAIYIPAILGHADALAEVEHAQQRLKDAEADQIKALTELAAANTAAAKSSTPENTLALVAADVAETAAKVQVKAAIDGVKVARDALKLSESTAKTVTQELAAADKEYLDLIHAATDAVVLPYADALDAERKAKDAAVIAANNLKTAEANLQAAYATGNVEKVEAAEVALTAARNDGKTKADALKIAQTNLNDARTVAQKIDKALLDGQTALDQAYTKFAPHLKSLGDEMKDVEQQQRNLIQAEKDEGDALDALQALKDAGVTSGQRLQDALDKETATKAKLTAADKLLTDAEKRLQSDYGLSASAIKFLIDSQTEGVGSAQLLADAYVDMGIKTQASLDITARVARDAYDAIVKDPTAGLQIKLAAITKEVDAEIAAGQKVPVDQQLQLAKMKQQQEDYITNSTQRWGDMYKTIVSGAKTLSDNMISDLFTGKGSFGQDAVAELQKIAISFTEQFFKPVTDAIAKFIAGALTDLLTGKGGLGDVLKSIKDIGTAFTQVFGSATSIATPPFSTTSSIPGIPGGLPGIPTGVSQIPTLPGPDGGAAGAAGAAGQIAGMGISAVAGLVTGAISAVTGIIGVFQSAHQETSLNAIEQNTRDSAFYLGGNNSGGGILLNTFRISDDIQYGYMSKNILAIKDAILSGSGMTGAASAPSELDPMFQNIALIQNNTYWAVAKLDAIWQLMQTGIPVGVIVPAASTSPSTAPSPSTATSESASTLTPQQQELLDLKTKQKNAETVLATLQDSYSKAVSQYGTDLAAMTSTSSEVAAIKQQISTAMQDLSDASDPAKQQEYRDLLTNLEGQLMAAQKQVADTQQAIQADLENQTALKQQIMDAQMQLAALIKAASEAAASAAQTAADVAAATQAARGRDTTPTTKPAPAPASAPTTAEILTDMSGKIWGALQTVIPKGWSMDQFGNWINVLQDIPTQLKNLAALGQLQGAQALLGTSAATPIVSSATPVAQADSLQRANLSIRGNVYLDSKELFSSHVQWAEDNGLVIPQG